MEYVKEITDQIFVINQALNSLGKPSLLQNADFVIDDMSWERWLKANYSKPGRINLTIILSPFGIQLDIDRVVEAYSIGQSAYEGNRDWFEKLMRMIFTSKIRVEYCGSNFTKIEFCDSNERCLDTIKHVQGLYLRVNCEAKQYDPIYEDT